MQTLVYLHGFRSSSHSQKARELGSALQAVRADWEYITPDLSYDPAIAFAQIEAIVARHPDPSHRISFIGSSLGGYYAYVFAEKLGCRAVLLNPSLKPYITLAAHLGTQVNLYSGEAFTFTTAHLDALRKEAPAPATSESANTLRNQNYLVIVEMGDTLLDHHETLSVLTGARVVVVPDGDHDLRSFPQHVGRVLGFTGLVDNDL